MINVIYARRSSERGDDLNLDTQIAACKSYAESSSNGLGECQIISEHVTGTIHLRDRKAGAQLWRQIESKQVGNVIVQYIDRLSRADVDEVIGLIKEILRAGVRLHSVDVGEILHGRDIGLIIKSWQAGEERRKTTERMVNAKHSKAKRGQWVGSGPEPYGFKRIGKLEDAHLEHNPDEIAVLKWLIDQYLSDPPVPINSLREALYQRSILSPKGRPIWANSTIAHVMSNPALIGRFTYGQDVIELPDLAIISPETLTAILDRMQSNREKSRRNSRETYPLAKRINCMCGRFMSATAQNRRGRHYRYYICTSNHQHRTERTCTTHRLRADELEAAVWKWTREHVTPDVLRDGIQRLEEYERDRDTDPRRLSDIDAETKRLQDHIAALMRQFTGTDRAPIVEARNLQINQDADRIEALAAERSQLANSLERAAARHALRDTLATRLGKLSGKLDGATPEQQAQVLDVINLRVKLIEQGRKSKSFKVLITSEIAPPDELTVTLA